MPGTLRLLMTEIRRHCKRGCLRRLKRREKEEVTFFEKKVTKKTFAGGLGTSGVFNRP
jgi:hypothetical protein